MIVATHNAQAAIGNGGRLSERREDLVVDCGADGHRAGRRTQRRTDGRVAVAVCGGCGGSEQGGASGDGPLHGDIVQNISACVCNARCEWCRQGLIDDGGLIVAGDDEHSCRSPDGDGERRSGHVAEFARVELQRAEAGARSKSQITTQKSAGVGERFGVAFRRNETLNNAATQAYVGQTEACFGSDGVGDADPDGVANDAACGSCKAAYLVEVWIQDGDDRIWREAAGWDGPGGGHGRKCRPTGSGGSFDDGVGVACA